MMSAIPATERVFFAKSELKPAHVPHVAMKKSSTSTFLGATNAVVAAAARRSKAERIFSKTDENNWLILDGNRNRSPSYRYRYY